jgi:hypothetical protein
MVRLGREVDALWRRKEADYLQRCLNVGQLVRQARARMGRGDFVRWLKKRSRVNTTSAYRYIALSTWAEGSPRKFQRLRTLGASKLFLLAPLEPSVFAKVVAVRIKRLSAMSARELEARVRRVLEGTRQPTMDRRIRSLELRTRRILRDVHALLDAHDPGADDLAKLRGLLLEAAETLHDA